MISWSHVSRWRNLELGLATLVLAAGGWFGVAEARARRAEQSWQRLEQQKSAVGSENFDSLARARAHSDRDRRKREALAAQWQSALGADVDVGTMDAGRMERAEAFFELVQKVEKFRRQLREAGVAVRETERFGFETYRTIGPSIAVLSAVGRQQSHVARLVDAVAAGRALALAGIEREAPGTEPNEGQGLADFFVPDPRLRLRLPQDAGQGLFRISFEGETGALRGFLARLAETSPDAFVRWIDAVPLTDDEVGTNTRRLATGARRFVVTVAFIDWPRKADSGPEVGS